MSKKTTDSPKKALAEHPLVVGLIGAAIGALLTFVLVSSHENKLQANEQAYEEKLAAPDLTMQCQDKQRRESDWPPDNTVLILPGKRQLGAVLSQEGLSLDKRHSSFIYSNISDTFVIPRDLPLGYYACVLRNDSGQAAKDASLSLSPYVVRYSRAGPALLSHDLPPIELPLNSIAPNGHASFAVMKAFKDDLALLKMPTVATYHTKVDPKPTTHPITANITLHFNDSQP